ncbi:MAG: YkgJ family cysteine cluster protein [Dokdonella sp.]
MALDIHPDDSKIDPSVSCSDCEAVCCRLTVVIDKADQIPEHLVAHAENGMVTMARGADGWCIALDRVTMSCGIYAQRPGVCRRFTMGGGYCRLEREKFANSGLSLVVV